MALIDTRRDQMFPVLNAVQMQTAERFASGPPRTFQAGEDVFHVGDRNAPSWLVLEGAIDLFRRDGLGHEELITQEQPGQFSGEVSQLAGRGSIAGGRAGPFGCRALPFDAVHLRALLIGAAELGEIIMRALILRRVGLLEAGGAGSILVGRPSEPDVLRLAGFLARNGYPYTVLDAAEAGEGHAVIDRLGVTPADLPLMICPNGEVLRRPTEAQAGACLGITPELDPDKIYDVLVVGAGPAGLATAVYAASEGLSVLVLDQRAMGGQAGASARIENYLGFPTGISGMALAGRAFNQAQKFGAEVAIPLQAARLDCEDPDRRLGDPLRVELTSGAVVQALTIVVASGASYRRPPIANLSTFEGAGVSYWASPVEARLCEGEDVALVGGGNSAGQAVAFLAPKVRQLHLIVRGPGLEASMSRYLIERIAALPNVVMHTDTEVAALKGDRAGGLRGAVFRHRKTGEEKTCPMRHMFLFIGADPNAAWLQESVDLDHNDFVITGAGSGGGAALPLETSRRGVFAIGDVRAGSTKRVAAAVGEGAAVVAQIHGVLAEINAIRAKGG